MNNYERDTKHPKARTEAQIRKENDPKYDFIHHATDNRLAEMLEDHNRWRRAEPPYDEVGSISKLSAKEVGILLDEAARRLRNTQRIIESKVPFNHEQFNV